MTVSYYSQIFNLLIYNVNMHFQSYFPAQHAYSHQNNILLLVLVYSSMAHCSPVEVDMSHFNEGDLSIYSDDQCPALTAQTTRKQHIRATGFKTSNSSIGLPAIQKPHHTTIQRSLGAQVAFDSIRSDRVKSLTVMRRVTVYIEVCHTG